LLRPYGIRSTTIRVEDGPIAKGYYLRSLEDVFSRYLPHPGVFSRYTVTNPGNVDQSEDFAAVTNPIRNGSENAGNASKSGICNGVTAKKGGNGDVEGIEALDDAGQDAPSEWDFDP
jgi:Protein of unknown function (DUF3631)